MCPDGGPRCRDSAEAVSQMPLVRELDPGSSPLAFFGAELRRARSAAGLSQEQLGQRVGYSAAQVGKVETGERAPSQDFAKRCDQAGGTAAIPPGSPSVSRPRGVQGP